VSTNLRRSWGERLWTPNHGYPTVMITATVLQGNPVHFQRHFVPQRAKKRSIVRLLLGENNFHFLLFVKYFVAVIGKSIMDARHKVLIKTKEGTLLERDHDCGGSGGGAGRKSFCSFSNRKTRSESWQFNYVFGASHDRL